MASKIETVLSVVDHASTTLKRVENQLQQFSKNGQGALAQMSAGGVAKMAALAGGVAAGVGVAVNTINNVIGKVQGFANETITAYGAAERSNAILQAALKSTGNVAGLTFSELKKMSSGLQDVTTVGDDTIESAQHLLLTFTGIGKKVFPEATETVLNMATVFGDLKSSATQVGKALNDPINGLTALRRVGVVFTDEQQRQIKTLQQSGDLLGAQKIILAELTKEYGGLARAVAGTKSGEVTQIKNKIGDIKEEIGQALIPAQKLGAQFELVWVTALNKSLGLMQRIGKAMPSAQDAIDKIKNEKSFADQIVAFNELQKKRQDDLKKLKDDLELWEGKQAELLNKKFRQPNEDHSNLIKQLKEKIADLTKETERYGQEAKGAQNAIEAQTQAEKDSIRGKEHLAQITRQYSSLQRTEKEKEITAVKDWADKELEIIGKNEQAKQMLSEISAKKIEDIELKYKLSGSVLRERTAREDAAKTLQIQKELYQSLAEHQKKFQKAGAGDRSNEMNSLLGWYNKQMEFKTDERSVSAVASVMDEQITSLLDKYDKLDTKSVSAVVDTRKLIEDAEMGRLNTIQDVNQRELAIHNEKFTRLKEMYADNSEALKNLEEAEAIERGNIIKAQEQRTQEDLKDIKKQYQNLAFQSASEAANAVFQITSNNTSREMQMELKKVDNSKMSEKKKERLREEIERKYFDKKKKSDSGQALMNGALGITKNIAELGFLKSIPVNLLTAFQTAAQVAVIKAQKFANGGISGIVPGTSWIGDKLLTGLNSGEIVMNREHINGVWRFLQDVKGGSSNSYTNNYSNSVTNSNSQVTHMHAYFPDISGEYKKQFEKSFRRGEMDDFIQAVALKAKSL